MPVRVLTLLDYYLPGYKAGGPPRTVQHMVERLGGDLDFTIVTRDRDADGSAPYPETAPSSHRRAGAARVRYLRAAELAPDVLRRVIAGTPHDVLYLNSVFSPRLTFAPLWLRRLGLIPRVPVVVAPRGELQPGALAARGWNAGVPDAVATRVPGPRTAKKLAYISAARASGITDGVTWQVSSDAEADDVRRHFGAAVRVRVAPDVTSAVSADEPRTVGKTAGELRVAFVSRISAKKNLRGAVELLAGVRGRVTLDIYGPVEDAAYWRTCTRAIAALPANISVHYHGPLPHAAVGPVWRAHHLFLFPTHGENFGHAILEALSAGCPVAVSDCTPWRGLTTAGVGWDLPLRAPDAFRAAVQRCVDMDTAEFDAWSRRAAAFARARRDDASVLDANRALFREAAAATCRVSARGRRAEIRPVAA